MKNNEVTAKWYPNTNKFIIKPDKDSVKIASILGCYSFTVDEVDEVLEKLSEYDLDLNLDFSFGDHLDNTKKVN